MSDREAQHLIAIARTVIEAGVNELNRADPNEPEVTVARIYIAMEIAAMMLEQELAECLVMGDLTPPDKSKLN